MCVHSVAWLSTTHVRQLTLQNLGWNPDLDGHKLLVSLGQELSYLSLNASLHPGVRGNLGGQIW